MIREITTSDYPRLMEIWESAVVHTHDFLKEEDFTYYKQAIPGYFEHVILFGIEENNQLAGFIGVSEGNIEMLFIHNDFRGKGLGKKLIIYGVEYLGITQVDVNEQNIQAVGFYKHMKFKVLKRSELDGQGKSYPILHMTLSKD